MTKIEVDTPNQTPFNLGDRPADSSYPPFLMQQQRLSDWSSSAMLYRQPYMQQQQQLPPTSMMNAAHYTYPNMSRGVGLFENQMLVSPTSHATWQYPGSTSPYTSSFSVNAFNMPTASAFVPQHPLAQQSKSMPIGTSATQPISMHGSPQHLGNKRTHSDDDEDVDSPESGHSAKGGEGSTSTTRQPRLHSDEHPVDKRHACAFSTTDLELYLWHVSRLQSPDQKALAESRASGLGVDKDSEGRTIYRCTAAFSVPNRLARHQTTMDPSKRPEPKKPKKAFAKRTMSRSSSADEVKDTELNGSTKGLRSTNGKGSDKEKDGGHNETFGNSNRFAVALSKQLLHEFRVVVQRKLNLELPESVFSPLETSVEDLSVRLSTYVHNLQQQDARGKELQPPVPALVTSGEAGYWKA